MFKPLIELYIPIFILVDVYVKQLILTPIISKKMETSTFCKNNIVGI